jgi:threonyl-tRNA synthetase
VILPLSCLLTDSYALALGRVVTHSDYPLLEKIVESAIKDRQKFERLVVSKEKLLEMFHVS